MILRVNKCIQVIGAAAGPASAGPEPMAPCSVSSANPPRPVSPCRTIKNSGLRSIQPRAFAKNPHLRYM